MRPTGISSGDPPPCLLARVKLMMAAFFLPYPVCATITDVLAALSVLSQAITDFRKCSSIENLKKALILQVHTKLGFVGSGHSSDTHTVAHMHTHTHTHTHTTSRTGSVLQLYWLHG